MDPAIEIKNLSVKVDNKFEILKDINLTLPKGKIAAFIGPSGAGKTTVIKCIVGRLGVHEGAVQVLGRPSGTPSLRKEMSYMTQELSVYTDLTVSENLKYFAYIQGIKGSSIKAEISRVLKLVDLTSKYSQLVSSLSGGEKQRVSLAVSLLGKPKLLVLDEPTVGLDPVLRDKLWKLFSDLTDQGITLVVSSHAMDEAERCDDLVLLRDGKVISHKAPLELLKETKSKTIEESFLKLVGDKV